MRLDKVVGPSQKLIFVCHSMGGIVARKFIVRESASLIDRGIEISLFLIASPSLGSDYANWLSPIAKFVGHAQADALRFGQGNAWLMDLDREFLDLKESGRLHLAGKELIEDRSIVLSGLLRKQIVEPMAGARYFGRPYKVPNSDHFSIPKVADADTVQHRLLREFVLNAAGRLPIAQALWNALEHRIDACNRAGVPIRMVLRLHVLFEVAPSLIERCFDSAVGPEKSNRIRRWINDAVVALVEKEAGHASFVASVANDPTVLNATEIAHGETAREVTARHFLIAILNDQSSGAVAEIRRTLGASQFKALQESAIHFGPDEETEQSEVPEIN